MSPQDFTGSGVLLTALAQPPKPMTQVNGQSQRNWLKIAIFADK